MRSTTLLADLPIFDTYQPIGHRHYAPIMSRKNKGRLELPIDILHQLQNTFTRLMVKISGRLVGQY